MIDSKKEHLETMHNDKSVPSVTRVINVLHWYRKNNSIPKQVLEYVGRRGKIIHGYVDKENKGIEYEIDLSFEVFMNHFHKWQEDYKPIVIASELYTYYDRVYKGICDMVLEIDGQIYVVDLKVSKTFIPYKAELQTGAYAKSIEHDYGIKADKTAMLRVSKTGYEFIVFDDIEKAYNDFVGLIHYYNIMCDVWEGKGDEISRNK